MHFPIDRKAHTTALMDQLWTTGWNGKYPELQIHLLCRIDQVIHALQMGGVPPELRPASNYEIMQQYLWPRTPQNLHYRSKTTYFTLSFVFVVCIRQLDSIC